MCVLSRLLCFSVPPFLAWGFHPQGDLLVQSGCCCTSHHISAPGEKWEEGMTGSTTHWLAAHPPLQALPSRPALEVPLTFHCSSPTAREAGKWCLLAGDMEGGGRGVGSGWAPACGTSSPVEACPGPPSRACPLPSVPFTWTPPGAPFTVFSRGPRLCESSSPHLKLRFLCKVRAAAFK